LSLSNPQGIGPRVQKIYAFTLFDWALTERGLIDRLPKIYHCDFSCLSERTCEFDSRLDTSLNLIYSKLSIIHLV